MKKTIFSVVLAGVLLAGCGSAQKAQTTQNQKSKMNKTEKGAVIGASSGAVVGAIIGNRSRNTVMGAILGAAAGGAVGAIIGNKMDKQAEKMKQALGNTATVERVGEGIKLTFNNQILFDFGKDDLKAANKDNLREFAETLQANPGTDLLIVGHTDNVGSDAYNQALSEKRAAAVSNFLAYQGVKNNRLSIMGQGENQPVVANTTETNRARNRRVEIDIVANEQMKEEAKNEVRQ